MSEALEQRLNEVLGYIRNQRQHLEQLRQRIGQLESVLDHCLGDPAGMWLWQNRVERMDPNVPIFDPLRARFHLARYEFAAGFARSRDVIDVACGTGYGCGLLSEKGAARSVLGFDLSPDAIAYARQRYATERVRFEAAPAEQLPVADGSCDLLTSFETIEHVDEDLPVIESFWRVLRPDGMLIISTPNQWPLEIAPCHTRVYDFESFCSLLSRRFTVTAVYNQNSGTAWEYNHNQPAGVTPTTEGNRSLAECYIAVCERKN